MAKKGAGRGAQGGGTIRKKTVKRNGQDYIYWEARVTVGRDPGTGKQIQRSFSGKTQKDVREKMQAAAVAVNDNSYSDPTKLTLGAWLDIWETEYLGDVKPRTKDSYKATIRNHIKPALGAVKLSALSPHEIQRFYNGLQKGEKSLSPKSVKNTHGVLHKALQQAVKVGYLKNNPADACELPRVEKAEIKPLDSEDIKKFLNAAKGHQYEAVYVVTLFTGMREGEVLGLTWDCVDFAAGTITVKQQLQRVRGEGVYKLVSTKNSKSRLITPAPSVMAILRQQRVKQMEWQRKSYGAWSNPLYLVFTNELGHNLSAQTVYLHFKRLAESIGLPSARFHDLRHSYAVAALQAGDDVKTVQETLGHHTAAFTLDVYGHVTEQMRRDSAARMEQFITDLQTAKQA